MIKKHLIDLIYSKPNFYKYYTIYKSFNTISLKKSNTFDIKDIIVCGVQRSGSTLLFNIINEIIHLNPQLVDTYFEDEIGYKKILSTEKSTLIKKTHVYTPLIAKRIKHMSSIGFFTHRDIRDIIVSFMQLGWLNRIDDWIENYKLKNMMYNSILYASTPHIHVISYDNMMHRRIHTIQEVANCLDIELSDDQVQVILNTTSIPSAKGYIHQEIIGSNAKYVSQFLPNHIADAEIEKWKVYLSHEDQKRLTNFCKEYLDFFGYELE